MTAQDWIAIGITAKMALVSSLLLLLIAVPLAYGMAHLKAKARPWAEAIVALPLVLPPTVLGFYILVALGPHGFVGETLENLGFSHLAFSFTGMVIGSMVYSFPFAVQPLVNAFVGIPNNMVQAAHTLGANRWDRLWSLYLPLSIPALVTSFVLSFAHTLGEFGVVLMIGGNIPGKTQVISTLIYDHVEQLDYAAANTLSLGLVLVSLLVLVCVYGFGQSTGRRPSAGTGR